MRSKVYTIYRMIRSCVRSVGDGMVGLYVCPTQNKWWERDYIIILLYEFLCVSYSSSYKGDSFVLFRIFVVHCTFWSTLILQKSSYKDFTYQLYYFLIPIFILYDFNKFKHKVFLLKPFCLINTSSLLSHFMYNYYMSKLTRIFKYWSYLICKL